MAQTSMPADGYMGNGARTTAEFQQGIEDMGSVIMELMGGAAETSVKTLASDTLTPSVDACVFPIQPETGTADNLATISTTSARDGSVVVIRNYNNSNTITIKHGTGNVYLSDSADYAINNTQDYIAFILRSTAWYELFRVEGNRLKALPGMRTETTATIASGMLPITQAITAVEGEGSVSDNLDGISSTFTGNMLIMRATNASHVITVRNNQSVSAGYYKILTLDGASVTLDSLTKYIMLHKDVSGTAWREVFRGGLEPVFQSTRTANTFLAGPSSGANAVPAFRAQVISDLPQDALYLQQNVRIYTSSGAPEAVAATRTNWYVGPYKGNVVSLPTDSTGNTFKALSFSEISTACPSDDFRIRDVFLYINSGAAAVETNPWDSGGQVTGSITGATAANPCVLTASNTLSAGDFIGIRGIVGSMGTDNTAGLNNKVWKIASRTSTTITLESGCNTTGLTYTSGGTFYKVPVSRTDSLTYQNGVYLKTSDKSRLFIGTIGVGFLDVSGTGSTGTSTISSGLSYSSGSMNNASCTVSNYFNKIVTGSTLLSYGTAAGTHSFLGTIRPFGANTGDRFEIINCLQDGTVGYPSSDFVSIQNAQVSTSAAGGVFQCPIGENTLLSGTTGVIGRTAVASQAVYVSGNATLAPVLGYKSITFLQIGTGGTAMTWTEQATRYTLYHSW